MLHRPVDLDAAELPAQPLEEVVAKRRDAGGVASGQGVGGQARRLAEADDAGHVQRTRAKPLLLSSALGLRLKANTRPARAPDVERAHPFRTVHLVGRDAHEIRSPLVDTNGHAPDGLHGIGVKQDPSLAAQPSDLRDRLNGPDLVVRRHHRNEDGVGTQGPGDLVRGDDAVRSDADDGDLESLALDRPRRLEHGRMLDRGRHQVTAARARHARRAPHGEVVRLRRPGGEHDVSRLGANQPRELGTRLFDRRMGLLSEGVLTARRVAELLGQVRQHRGHHRGVQRGRRVMIEVDGAGRHTSFFHLQGGTRHRLDV